LNTKEKRTPLTLLLQKKLLDLHSMTTAGKLLSALERTKFAVQFEIQIENKWRNNTRLFARLWMEISFSKFRWYWMKFKWWIPQKLPKYVLMSCGLMPSIAPAVCVCEFINVALMKRKRVIIFPLPVSQSIPQHPLITLNVMYVESQNL